MIFFARKLLVFSCFSLIAAAQQPSAIPVSGASELHQAFAHPPDDSRIMMRWWWFGPSATKDELKRELEQMKAAGIGGVEIARRTRRRWMIRAGSTITRSYRMSTLRI